MHVRDIKATVSTVRAVLAGVGGFVRRHRRLTIAVVVALLLAAPLLTGGADLAIVNAVGLGIGALLLRGFLSRRPAGRSRRR